MYYEEYNHEMVLVLVRKYFHLQSKFQFLIIFISTINLLDDVVVVVVGQVETNSLVLFFIGNEKSFRGQQLTSIIRKDEYMCVCVFISNDICSE